MKRAFLVGRYSRKRHSFVLLRPTRSPIVGPFSLRAVVAPVVIALVNSTTK